MRSKLTGEKKKKKEDQLQNKANHKTNTEVLVHGKWSNTKSPCGSLDRGAAPENFEQFSHLQL